MPHRWMLWSKRLFSPGQLLLHTQANHAARGMLFLLFYGWELSSLLLDSWVLLCIWQTALPTINLRSDFVCCWFRLHFGWLTDMTFGPGVKKKHCGTQRFSALHSLWGSYHITARFFQQQFVRIHLSQTLQCVQPRLSYFWMAQRSNTSDHDRSSMTTVDVNRWSMKLQQGLWWCVFREPREWAQRFWWLMTLPSVMSNKRVMQFAWLAMTPPYIIM